VPPAPTAPDWDRLFDFAVGQDGLFTTRQAAEAGYSPQLLLKYLKNGRVVRVRRGIYRIVHYPAGEHEDLTALYLWCDREGVFSHETALFLHQLSDVLPRKVHLTLPSSWAQRRLRTPKGVVLHHEAVPRRERIELGAVPITSVPRTLRDCARAHVSPELVEAAVRQAEHRKLVTKAEARHILAEGSAA